MTGTNPSDQASVNPNTDSGGSSQMRHSDPRQRRNIALLLVGMTVFAALLLLVGLPQYKRWVSAGSTQDVLKKMTWVFYGMSLLLLLAAAWVGAYARRIFRSGESPPPGSWVLRDTVIRRGGSARIRGWGMVVCVVCLVLLAAYAISVPIHLRTIAHAAAVRLQIHVQR